MLLKLKKFVHRSLDYIIHPVLRRHAIYQPPDAAAQLQLMLTYQNLVRENKPLPPLRDTGFRVYSECDEDGILLYIFSLIGWTNKRCVEVCAGDGIQCNTTNLILHHGFNGLLIDGDSELVNRGRKFFMRHPNTAVFPPPFVHAWITKRNINELISNHGFSGEIDLLSLDMDGMDYWILSELNVIQPRVIVLEYLEIIGPERAITVPYSDDFWGFAKYTTNGMMDYAGASLLAFTKLLAGRGYRLVGCNRFNYNAFFVKEELARDVLPGAKVSDCFSHPKAQWGMAERFPKVKDLPWVDV